MGLRARSLSSQTIGSNRRRSEATLGVYRLVDAGATEPDPRSSEADFTSPSRPTPPSRGSCCGPCLFQADFIALGPLDTAALTR